MFDRLKFDSKYEIIEMNDRLSYVCKYMISYV